MTAPSSPCPMFFGNLPSEMKSTNSSYFSLSLSTPFSRLFVFSFLKVPKKRDKCYNNTFSRFSRKPRGGSFRPLKVSRKPQGESFLAFESFTKIPEGEDRKEHKQPPTLLKTPRRRKQNDEENKMKRCFYVGTFFSSRFYFPTLFLPNFVWGVEN